ncbi:MAG: TatD family hydrolase [Verrucomicrobiae bacterium]|nr:TatD family hydrolase [Verrucomicrobiae bacterium]
MVGWMLEWVDTHAHLTFPELASELEGVLARARAAGVGAIVSIGCDPESSQRTVALAQAQPGVWASVGLHPGYVPDVSLCDLKTIRALAQEPKVVAIGETGLDYYRLPSVPADAAAIIRQQKDLLWAQLDLARSLRKPVVIHNRSADADLMEILRAHEPGFVPWGVMHCFSGDSRLAFECLELGLMISFTGILTFRNAGSLREVARQVPLSRIMLETDAPYLAPVPHRGRRNEPSYLPAIASVLAEVKNISVEEVARVTTDNARALFGLS